MDAITLREENNESNIGTVICNGMSPMYTLDRIEKSLVSHYDSDVKFNMTEDIVERLNSKGVATLDVTVNGSYDDDTSYTTVVTLERTWIY